ncbi:hypothetical protein, partial [Rhodanobacter terrae]
PRQSLSVGLNVQICTESNCRGRRDRRFGRPFVNTEFFNRIGHELPVGESVTSPDSRRSALGMFNTIGQHANMRRPQ